MGQAIIALKLIDGTWISVGKNGITAIHEADMKDGSIAYDCMNRTEKKFRVHERRIMYVEYKT
jgi:hypothetical protein